MMNQDGRRFRAPASGSEGEAQSGSGGAVPAGVTPAGSERATISIEQFGQVELRVATVLRAEPHPNADKLLALHVDLGTHQRQVIAGIRGHYKPEELVGSQVVIVSNLARRAMRGAVSEGMLLAACTPDRSQVVVIRPERPVPPGTLVS
jgi:methionine--tRNA ligase beta chain